MKGDIEETDMTAARHAPDSHDTKIDTNRWSKNGLPLGSVTDEVFTKEESDLILKSINEYCVTKNITTTQLCSEYDDNSELRGAWQVIAKAIPHRSVQSIYRYGIRRCQPVKRDAQTNITTEIPLNKAQDVGKMSNISHKPSRGDDVADRPTSFDLSSCASSVSSSNLRVSNELPQILRSSESTSFEDQSHRAGRQRSFSLPSSPAVHSGQVSVDPSGASARPLSSILVRAILQRDMINTPTIMMLPPIIRDFPQQPISCFTPIGENQDSIPSSSLPTADHTTSNPFSFTGGSLPTMTSLPKRRASDPPEGSIRRQRLSARMGMQMSLIGSNTAPSDQPVRLVKRQHSPSSTISLSPERQQALNQEPSIASEVRSTSSQKRPRSSSKSKSDKPDGFGALKNKLNAKIKVVKPKKARTAYNYFLQTERQRIKAEQLAAVHASGVPRNLISFSDMGKEIGRRWKNVSPERLEECQRLADADRKRYEAEALKYKKQHEEAMELAQKDLQNSISEDQMKEYLKSCENAEASLARVGRSPVPKKKHKASRS